MLRFFLSLLLYFNFCFCFSQKGLRGYYSEEFENIAESDRRIQFRKDSTFTYEMWDDVGNYFGVGNYHINRDTLFLHFQNINRQEESLKVIAQENHDSVSSIVVFNTYFREEFWQFNYSIFEGDSLIKKGKSNTLGRAYFTLKTKQFINVVAYPLCSKSLLQQPLHFKVEATQKNQEFVAFLNAFPKDTKFIEDKIIAYPIKRYRNRKFFLIHDYYGWQKFKRVK